MFRRHLVFLTVVLFIQITGLKAQTNESISSNLQVFKITQTESGETATKVSEIKPGDTIEYRLTYTNNSENPIADLVPVLPIPVGMQYLEDSASPNLLGASINNTGNDFKSLPLTQTVTNEDGQQVTQEIPAREYRRLQWQVSTLAAGESITLSARVKIIRE